jgi:hypothetical protein
MSPEWRSRGRQAVATPTRSGAVGTGPPDLTRSVRDCSPGLNRFLSRDSYTGALADLQLTVSPWTGNRYAFAGGNPITGIELDGHRITQCDGPCTQENPGQWENPTTGEIEGSAFDISVQFITHEMVRNAEGPTGSWLTVLHLDSRSFGDFAGNVAIVDALLGIPYNATTSRDEAALALWGWKVRQEGDWDHKPDLLRIFDQQIFLHACARIFQRKFGCRAGY